eukprot:TRINITY_DN38464_c0_g1_i1.p9 TRINITY_DN38464_c0_g1~~TRINITY_DN38464_c0_g1_i1.p9  ORF type:complete len:115 (+),score=1.25 TRINITY_DN38464_c0_g1_i1:1113-1457(+)
MSLHNNFCDYVSVTVEYLLQKQCALLKHRTAFNLYQRQYIFFGFLKIFILDKPNNQIQEDSAASFFGLCGFFPSILSLKRIVVKKFKLRSVDYSEHLEINFKNVIIWLVEFSKG